MTKLKLICRQQEAFERALHAQIQGFEAEHTDVKIECEFLPIHDHYEKMVERGGALSGDYDLFFCCTDWLPTVIGQNKLICLDPFLKQKPPADWPEGWHPAMRKLIHKNEKVFGLPWHDGPEVLHYRSDLFHDEAEKLAFSNQFGRELALPQTWKEFIEVARFFTRPAEGLWGCCQAAFTDGHNNVYDFLIQLWSRGGVLIDESFQPHFHEPIGVEALQFYVDLFHRYKVASLDCLNLGSVECGDYYAQGNAAMSWNWIGFAAACELPPSKVVGKNRCAKIPAGEGVKGRSVSLNIYWALTIPSGSKNQDAAYQFLEFVSRPKWDKLTSQSGANGTRLSTWRDPEIQSQFEYYRVIETVHESTLTLPAIPEYGEINESISRAVHRAVNLEMDCAPSLAIAADEVSQILKSRA